MKAKIYIIGIIVLTAITLSAGALVMDESTMFLEKRAELVIREIGHKLLLRSGDSTSRILPVKKIDNHTFQLEFQSQFTFVPDTLVEIVHQRLTTAQLPLDYMVNVFDCENNNMLFGYEMRTKKSDVLPCLGRTQPIGCYKIQIEFTEVNTANKFRNAGWAFGFISVAVLLISFLGKRPVPKKAQSQVGAEEIFIEVGKYAFYAEKGVLKNGNELIELSDKETKLLHVFASHQNQVIERDRLLKEVWEDEGVFVVGRSLDVFVSKLRKKLQGDDRLKITNIHGKGYKLEVEE